MEAKVAIAPWAAWMAPAEQAEKYQAEAAGATVSVAPAGPSKAKIELTCSTDPKVYDQPLFIQADFTPRWRNYACDVQVLDGNGKAILARRRLEGVSTQVLIPVAPQSGTYYLEAVDPRAGQPPVLDDSGRTAREAATGVTASVCRWYDGRQAAVTFRFDDSHPSHILTAIPMLREYGFKGTFFINPGSPGYQSHRAEWEACAAQGDQEFADHSMRHRGSRNDAETDQEIGETARYIRTLFPGKSALLCFSPGGGTMWTYSGRLRTVLDKYDLYFDLFDVSPRVGISVQEGSAEAYRTTLEGAIEKGVLFTGLFHRIDPTGVTPATFRGMLETTKRHAAEIWVAGGTDVFKYFQERNAAALTWASGGAGGLTLALTCATDAKLYDQPLTIELALPDGWRAQDLKVRNGQGAAVPTRVATVAGQSVVRFDVPPVTGKYALSR
jgi:hypothetical protein